MKNADKKRIQKLIDKLESIKSDCCNLMEARVVPDMSIDLPSLDEAIYSLESQLS